MKDTTLWYHHKHGSMTWSELKRMFATVGGITKRRANMLGWFTDEAQANNPVQRMLG